MIDCFHLIPGKVEACGVQLVPPDRPGEAIAHTPLFCSRQFFAEVHGRYSFQVEEDIPLDILRLLTKCFLEQRDKDALMVMHKEGFIDDKIYKKLMKIVK